MHCSLCQPAKSLSLYIILLYDSHCFRIPSNPSLSSSGPVRKTVSSCMHKVPIWGVNYHEVKAALIGITQHTITQDESSMEALRILQYRIREYVSYYGHVKGLRASWAFPRFLHPGRDRRLWRPRRLQCTQYPARTLTLGCSNAAASCAASPLASSSSATTCTPIHSSLPGTS